LILPIRKQERFDLSICNPTFHSSAEEAAGAKEVRTIEMAHGQKQSRIVAWTFFPVGSTHLAK